MSCILPSTETAAIASLREIQQAIDVDVSGVVDIMASRQAPLFQAFDALLANVDSRVENGDDNGDDNKNADKNGVENNTVNKAESFDSLLTQPAVLQQILDRHDLSNVYRFAFEYFREKSKHHQIDLRQRLPEILATLPHDLCRLIVEFCDPG